MVKTHGQQDQLKEEMKRPLLRALELLGMIQSDLDLFGPQPQRLAEIEGLVIEDNVVEWALSSAKVQEKPVAFDELMGQQRG